MEMVWREGGMKMLHELKIYPMHFNDILKNNKNFEVRKDDRLYEVGDYLYLR